MTRCGGTCIGKRKNGLSSVFAVKWWASEKSMARTDRRTGSCQVVVHYCQVKQLNHPYTYPINDGTEIEMNAERFKVIERSTVESVVEIADRLIGRGYKPVAEIMKIPKTGLFTQVMHWEPQYRTPKLHAYDNMTPWS